MVKKRVKGKSYSQFLFVLIVVIPSVIISLVFISGLGELMFFYPDGVIYEPNTHAISRLYYNLSHLNIKSITSICPGSPYYVFEINLTNVGAYDYCDNFTYMPPYGYGPCDLSGFSRSNLFVDYQGRPLLIELWNPGQPEHPQFNFTGGFVDGIMNVTLMYNNTIGNETLTLIRIYDGYLQYWNSESVLFNVDLIENCSY